MDTVTLYDKNNKPIIVNVCDAEQYRANGFTDTDKKPRTATTKKSDVNGNKG